MKISKSTRAAAMRTSGLLSLACSTRLDSCGSPKLSHQAASTGALAPSCVRHSIGGVTLRVLQQLLADGAFPGHATSAAWVRSVTALASPLNGDPVVYGLGACLPVDAATLHEPRGHSRLCRTGDALTAGPRHGRRATCHDTRCQTRPYPAYWLRRSCPWPPPFLPWSIFSR